MSSTTASPGTGEEALTAVSMALIIVIAVVAVLFVTILVLMCKRSKRMSKLAAENLPDGGGLVLNEQQKESHNAVPARKSPTHVDGELPQISTKNTRGCRGINLQYDIDSSTDDNMHGPTADDSEEKIVYDSLANLGLEDVKIPAGIDEQYSKVSHTMKKRWSLFRTRNPLPGKIAVVANNPAYSLCAGSKGPAYATATDDSTDPEYASLDQLYKRESSEYANVDFLPSGSISVKEDGDRFSLTSRKSISKHEGHYSLATKGDSCGTDFTRDEVTVPTSGKTLPSDDHDTRSIIPGQAHDSSSVKNHRTRARLPRPTSVEQVRYATEKEFDHHTDGTGEKNIATDRIRDGNTTPAENCIDTRGSSIADDTNTKHQHPHWLEEAEDTVATHPSRCGPPSTEHDTCGDAVQLTVAPTLGNGTMENFSRDTHSTDTDNAAGYIFSTNSTPSPSTATSSREGSSVPVQRTHGKTDPNVSDDSYLEVSGHSQDTVVASSVETARATEHILSV
eukprot:m.454357 g.454357  ORF g.454357 m.454357 type:complete len:507 (-) comp21568_c0_seq1:429-1949(-)